MQVGQDVFVASAGQDLPSAKVVVLDIETCAGVIHVIDEVLLAIDHDEDDAPKGSYGEVGSYGDVLPESYGSYGDSEPELISAGGAQLQRMGFSKGFEQSIRRRPVLVFEA